MDYPDDSLLPYSYTFLPPSHPPSLPPSLPQVFADYQKFLSTHGPGPRFLPTPSFYYGMEIGKQFTQTFSLPSSLGEYLFSVHGIFFLISLPFFVPRFLTLLYQSTQPPASLPSFLPPSQSNKTWDWRAAAIVTTWSPSPWR